MRANRLTIKAFADGTVNGDMGFVADFYKTHKKVMTIYSQDIDEEWMKHDMADKATTRTQLREDFREYVITNASTWGIDWQPQDMRTDANIRKAKYTTDEELIEDAMALIDADMNEFINNISDVTGYSITCDGINPVKVSAKGYDLSKLGVIDGKYEKNGNWAWAEVIISYGIEIETEHAFIDCVVQLVSGQLKKPSGFNEIKGYNKTNFIKIVRDQVPVKEETPTPKEEVQQTKISVEPKEEIPTPKNRGRKPKTDK